MAASALATVILARVVWVMSHTAFVRWRIPGFGIGPRRHADRGKPGDWHGGMIVAWCGMRGIVTLAAALALPDDFPHRDLLQFVAFAVLLGTLVLPGMTLRPLLSVLTLHDDQLVESEVRMARVETARAAVSDLENAPDTHARTALLAEYRRGGEVPRDGMAGLQQTAVQAQRRMLGIPPLKAAWA
ncbi:hypothetical protein HN018_26620 (plasmid) [Lichenicola cladoniae]|uniref:Cation/H+ exchanger transmembrane domain-containing protein n=1 Tax=Lichenicola cladoniae TaxID=1484109 RepID=A0A6M8HYU1_9PROT|nr:cation:proton antiporter [Lichenicola cladoniae]NPD70438.1 hypothetical protein [Acetobacteraceae bacterium]QKE93709.1 hypothetical protein HN018_26620 [Lichenicola cladoniae]